MYTNFAVFLTKFTQWFIIFKEKVLIPVLTPGCKFGCISADFMSKYLTTFGKKFLVGAKSFYERGTIKSSVHDQKERAVTFLVRISLIKRPACLYGLNFAEGFEPSSNQLHAINTFLIIFYSNFNMTDSISIRSTQKIMFFAI